MARRVILPSLRTGKRRTASLAARFRALHAVDRGETRVVMPGKGSSGVACLSTTAVKHASIDVDFQLTIAPADHVACVHPVRACALITVYISLGRHLPCAPIVAAYGAQSTFRPLSRRGCAEARGARITLWQRLRCASKTLSAWSPVEFMFMLAA
jgi:hypothetical protein